MDELLREFIAETSEHLAALDHALIAVERSPNDPRLLRDAFRVVHNIKGACGFLNLKRLETLLHAAENVLGQIRDGALIVSPAAIGTLLAAGDRARSLVAALAKDGYEPEGADADIVARLELAARAARPRTVKAGPDSSAAEPVGAARSIRVNLDALERLMAEVGELVLTRNRLMQLMRGRSDSEFAPDLRRLSHITGELQELVMRTRMQPIGQAWAKLPRIVRDLARDLGKTIELRLDGAETELDRQLLEMIKDPLTHLVRNAADHGIETPQERRRRGKPEAGTIVLSAGRQGGTIVITLSDDGRGIDAEAIRSSVRQAGLASDAELEAMSERQLQQFVFRPGFTTAPSVTSLSGRGVGLDVVRGNIEKLGGTVELRSQADSGTEFVIRLPLTLAIVPALILACAGQRFAIPQAAVAELIRTGSQHRIEWLGDAPMLRSRGELLPLVVLREILGLGRGAPGEGSLIAVIGGGAQRFGMIIEAVDEVEEIVAKPLAPILRGAALFAGSAILGNGQVILVLDPAELAAAAGASDSGAGHSAAVMASRETGARAAALLVFRAGAETPMAVPLASVVRIEKIAPRQVERIDGRAVIQYRGGLLPLVSLGSGAVEVDPQRVVVIAQGGASIGLLVEEILDTVEDAPALDATLARAGFLGATPIAGGLVEILDVPHFLAAAGQAGRKQARNAA